MITLQVALDAVATVRKPEDGADDGACDVSVVDLVVGVARTSLAPGEVVRCFTVPVAALVSRVPAAVSLAPQGRIGAIVVARPDPQASGAVVTVIGGIERPHRIELGALDDEALEATLAELTDRLNKQHGTPPGRRAVISDDSTPPAV